MELIFRMGDRRFARFCWTDRGVGPSLPVGNIQQFQRVFDKRLRAMN
jgi:hypothetical protein